MVLGLTVGAHAAAAGALPSPSSFAMPAVAVFLIVQAVTALRPRPWLLLGVLGACQWGLHHLMAALGGGSAETNHAAGHAAMGHSATSHASMDHTAMDHSAMHQAVGDVATADPLHDAATGASSHAAMHGSSLTMLLSHAVATLALTWLLAQGEQLVRSALAWLLPRLPDGRPARPRAPRPAIALLDTPPTQARCWSVQVRGPPALAR